MFRIDDATAATSLPMPEAAGTEGHWTEGSPVGGTPATNIRASWLNMIQEELCAILAAAGITRSKTTYNQVNAALQKLYSPVIGSSRNVAMSVTAASAIATLTADEIVVGAALGGQKYMLSGFNKPINLATTGAGGMDTGTAPNSGYVAIYAIWNPTTSTAALLATNATSAVAPNVYGGANMPSGYTASALLSVWGTNGSGQLIIGSQLDRVISLVPVVVLSTSGQAASYTSIAFSNVVPKNAKTARGFSLVTSSSASVTISMAIAGSSIGVGGSQHSATTPTAGAGLSVSFPHTLMTTAQTLYYTATVGGGTMGFNLSISEYAI
jgi:hypothetical protein